jgi:O-antigen ligase
VIDTFRRAAMDRTTYVVAVLLGLHAMAAVLFLVDFRLPFALLIMAIAGFVGVEMPLAGVAMLVAGRLTSTGANAWVRIGKVNLDLFEPSLMLALGALFVHAGIHKKRVFVEAPWRGLVVAFLAFQAASLLWSSNPEECVQEVIATGVLLATTLAILAFVRTWDDLRRLLYVWIAASMFIAVASFLGLAASEESAFEMAQGSRESGFGQHPNWFAMNLMYAVLVSFGLVLTEKAGWRKALFALCGLFVFFAQMQSGSRGGTGSILIGAGIVSMLDPRFRKLALLSAPVAAAVIGAVIYLDIGDAANAFARIFVEGSAEVLGKSVRVSNWEVCFQMFFETWGLGIGGGGYEDLLGKYDAWLASSQYRYPHGIFWGMIAHYGVVGVTLYGLFVLTVARMGFDMLRWTKGSENDPKKRDLYDYRVLALCMMGSMMGYWAWSFVEFMYDDKPFWEFLGLYTALWRIVKDRAGA